MFPKDGSLLDESINSIISFIKDNNELMAILGEVDYYELGNVIKMHVINQKYDLNNLSDEDRLIIVESVLMDYF